MKGAINFALACKRWPQRKRIWLANLIAENDGIIGTLDNRR